MKWLWIILAVIAFIIGRTVWRIIQYLPRARRDIADLRAEDFPELITECERTFADKFQIGLRNKTTSEAVEALDQHLRRKNIWSFFRYRKQPGWRYAKVTGCYLGELVKRETGASWKFQAGLPPILELERGEASFIADPFERVLRHHIQGTDGDLVAWFSTLRVVGRRIHKEEIPNDTSG